MFQFMKYLGAIIAVTVLCISIMYSGTPQRTSFAKGAFSLVIPTGLTVQNGLHKAEHFSTSLFADTAMIMLQKTPSSNEQNAVAFTFTNGDKAIIFDCAGTYVSIPDMLQRLSIMQQNIVNAQGSSPMLFNQGSSNIGGTVAMDIDAKLATAKGDTIYTKVAVGEYGSADSKRSIGIIYRSKRPADNAASNQSRQQYLSLTRTLICENIFTSASKVECSTGLFTMPVPTGWTLIKKIGANPLPSRSEFEASPKMPVLLNAGDSLPDWNVMVVQNGLCQIEIISTPVNGEARTQKELLADALSYIGKTTGLPEAKIRCVKSDAVAGMNGIECSYVVSRTRGETRYVWFVGAATNGRQYTIRTTAWDRDMQAVGLIVGKYLKYITLQQPR
ncbi:MAG: hypothetical protein JNL32_05830 [Candidatus Kapabacteria bacterium]|nr:hypothetical protein [Candidatus Kapabacteria bacterium]